MTTNNTETIIKYLNLYNKWRRDDEKMGQPNPTEIGKLIDEACEMLTLLQCERDEWKNKAYSHATDYTLMEAKCFRLEQQLKEYDQLKS